MNKGYFNTNEGSQRISGNPATDLYAGMNRTSDFGNLENAGNKRIATRKQNLQDVKNLVNLCLKNLRF
jgi:hypothetical protein